MYKRNFACKIVSVRYKSQKRNEGHVMLESRISSSFRKNALMNHLVLLAKTTPTKENSKFVTQHLKDCIENPTIGLLAREHFKRGGLSGEYYNNLNTVKQISDEYASVKENFDKKLEELYPKTQRARQYLIKSGSIVLDKIKPIQKTIERTFFKYFGLY